jgi:predicted glutamine amidotransferase
MCRYAAYLGPHLALSELIYKPANSLVHQATEAMQSPTRINADGFGVGWYADDNPEPAVFKDTTPVWNNYNLGSIAGKIRSRCIFAHVRAAKSFDPVGRENSHPFARGRLLWMHNGDIPGRARLTRQVGEVANDALLASIRGNTDSEMAFTLFLTHLSDPFSSRETLSAELATAMEATLMEIAGWHRESGEERPLEMNFCVTDGHCLVAVRYALSDHSGPTLHWFKSAADGSEPRVLVSSEPLYPEDDWKRLENGSLIVVDENRHVEIRQLAPLGPTLQPSPPIRASAAGTS